MGEAESRRFIRSGGLPLLSLGFCAFPGVVRLTFLYNRFAAS